MLENKHIKVVPHLRSLENNLVKGCVITDQNVCTVVDEAACIFTDICDIDKGSLCIIDICGNDYT